jgi:hypothetical protein
LRFFSAAASLVTSPLAKPHQGVAQKTTLCSLAIICTPVASTSWSEPNRPWPYREIRAGSVTLAELGTRHSNWPVAMLPGLWVGVASGLEEL